MTNDSPSLERMKNLQALITALELRDLTIAEIAEFLRDGVPQYITEEDVKEALRENLIIEEDGAFLCYFGEGQAKKFDSLDKADSFLWENFHLFEQRIWTTCGGSHEQLKQGNTQRPRQGC